MPEPFTNHLTGPQGHAPDRLLMLDASRTPGVEPNEGHLLTYTTLYGPCPVSQLSRVFGHKPSTLTGILDRLEGAGLLVREPNEADRRSFLIRVTPEGAASRSPQPDQAIDWETMVARLTESEERFMAALDAMDEARLDDGGLTDPFGNETTRGELLNLLAVHQNYHAGQLGLVRRIAGLPGVIKGPEREPAEA